MDTSKAAAAMGRAGRGASKRRGDSEHYRALAAKRRPRVWYAIAELPRGSRFAASDRMTVVAFGSAAERAAWVDQPHESRVPILQTHGEERRAIDRRAAAIALSAIMTSTVGGRPSVADGLASLRDLGVSSLVELGVR